MKFRGLLTAHAVALTLCGSSLAASGNKPVDIPERAKGAQRIVVATATSITAGWRQNEFGDEVIVSEVGLRVEETIKGAPLGFAVLELEGGTLDGLTMRVSTLPTLEPGERGVFFLNSTPRGSHVAHLKGLGILKLDANDTVKGSSLQLDDVRRMSKGR